MLVLPAGQFMMGSSADDPEHYDNEGPLHRVTIAQPLAVSKFEVTFADWDACAAYGDCDPNISDGGFGRGRQPAINVSWTDAQTYPAWLSKMTGKRYTLLSEAEYEYAARAGTTTAFPWGDESGASNANCKGCGSRWDGRHRAAASTRCR